MVTVHTSSYCFWDRDDLLLEREFAPALRAAYLGGKESVALRLDDAAMVRIVRDKRCSSQSLLLL
jgi:hypothetical protein